MTTEDDELAGLDDLAIFNKLAAKNEEREARELADAKAAALASGKEPFDLAKLETMCDTSFEGRVDPVEKRQKKFETIYYVEYPDIRTLQEFAAKVTERSRWGL